MKIMFVIDAMNKGGAERVISNLSNYFIKNNEVAIVTIDGMYSKYALNENIKRYCITDFNTKNNLTYKITKLKKRIKNLVKYKKEFNPDIVISFLPRSCFYTLFSNFFFKTKTIVSERNDPRISFKKIKYRIMMKLLYPTANGFVFQTSGAKEYFSKKIQSKSAIIPNPLNIDFLNKVYKGHREKTIVNVGRLVKQKNQKLLIDAFYIVSKKYPDYKLIIYGEGALREELENLIKEYKLSDKVFLPGNVEDIKGKLEKAGMFVLSSLYEGMPNSLMEALALGVPSISTDCPAGGSKFLINNGVNGLLIENDNKNDLVEAIEKIIEDKDFCKKISKESSKIREKLHPKIINKMWEDYIFKVINNSK